MGALDWTETRLARLDARRPLRRLPGLVRDAARLLWRASPRRFALTSVLQLCIAAGAAAQLLAGRDALALVLSAPETGTGFETLVGPLLWLAMVTGLLQVLRAAQGLSEEGLRSEVAHAALGEVLDVATVVDLEAFESAGFFDRLQRATMAARDRPWATVRALLGLGSSLLGFVALGSVLAALQPILVPFVVFATLPGLFVSTRLTRARHRLHLQLAQSARREEYLVSVLIGRDEAKEIRSFNLAGALRRMHDELAKHRISEQLKLARRSARERLLATSLTSLTSGAGLAVLVSLVIQARLDPAGAAAAAYAMQRIQAWLGTALSSVTSLYDGTYFLDDYSAFLELGHDARDHRPSATLAHPFQTVRVTDASFAYPGAGTTALDNIDLEFGAGEVIALVGENGSGKTTLAKLLSGLYRPTAGHITWDGVDLCQVDPASVRNHVAVIFQDFARYRLSARDNIVLGRTERTVDDSDVEAAARAAGADGFLSQLPLGYDTMLAKDLVGGADLSIGQWQRVALARAFFRDAPFLVLDEPTAALDPAAEHQLFEHIRSLASGRTVLLISHRFSSVRNANRIFVLERGRLIEQGSHDELMALAGHYAHLFMLQAQAYLPG